MERWKLTHAARYGDGPKDEKLSGPSRELVNAVKEADVVYQCEHRIATYKLRPDEGLFYYLPNPICLNCVAEIPMTFLFRVPRADFSEHGI